MARVGRATAVYKAVARTAKTDVTTQHHLAELRCSHIGVCRSTRRQEDAIRRPAAGTVSSGQQRAEKACASAPFSSGRERSTVPTSVSRLLSTTRDRARRDAPVSRRRRAAPRSQAAQVSGEIGRHQIEHGVDAASRKALVPTVVGHAAEVEPDAARARASYASGWCRWSDAVRRLHRAVRHRPTVMSRVSPAACRAA